MLVSLLILAAAPQLAASLGYDVAVCACGIVSLLFEADAAAAARVMRPRTVWPAIHGSRRVKHGMSGMNGRVKCHSRPPGLCLMIIVRRRAASSAHDAIRSVAWLT